VSEYRGKESTAEALGDAEVAPWAQRQLSTKISVDPLFNFQIFLK